MIDEETLTYYLSKIKEIKTKIQDLKPEIAYYEQRLSSLETQLKAYQDEINEHNPGSLAYY